MGKLTGIIRFTGRLGGLSIYEMNGQHIVRQAYGPDAETIRKNPNYKGLRERNQEFGNVSKAAKLLRSGFPSLLQELGDKNVHHRLTQALLSIKNLDTESAKGSRHVGIGLSTKEGRNLLSGFSCRATGREDETILSAGRKAIKKETFNLSWSPNLLLPKGGSEIHLDLIWIKVDFARQRIESAISEKAILKPAGAKIVIPMPTALEGKDGFLFLALGVQYGRLDGSVIGKDRWKGLWLM
jgi:hypothetical protein